MKKLLLFLLFVLLVMGINAQVKKNKDTVGDVCVPYPIMKTIQTDLLVGDSAVAVLNITNVEVRELKNKVLFHMNEAENLRLSVSNLKSINDNLTQQASLHEGIVNTLKQDYNVLSKSFKRNKVKNTIWDILLIGGAAILTGELLYYRNLYIKTM
jgi:hypothetical protein